MAMTLTEAEVPVPSKSLGFYDETIRRVWCQSPKPEYKAEEQRYCMPGRCIPLMRPDVDLIVLPGNHGPTAEAWEVYKGILGLSDSQVVWTSGSLFNMDDDMCSDTVRTLEAKMTEAAGAHWLLLPYCPTPNFYRWASPLVSRLDGAASMFGETTEWLAKYGDKGLLHRKISSLDTPCMIEEIDPTIAVPKGYVCETVDELLEARKLLADVEHVCIKPLAGATGVGIVLKPSLKDLQEYNFHMGPVSLEEYLNLDTDERGEAISPVLHYMGNKFCGNYMLDQIMLGTMYLGWQRTAVSEDFQRVGVPRARVSHQRGRRGLSLGRRQAVSRGHQLWAFQRRSPSEALSSGARPSRHNLLLLEAEQGGYLCAQCCGCLHLARRLAPNARRGRPCVRPLD